MSPISGIAIFFIIWWVVLFTVLPIGVKSQVEEEDVTLGTDHGAPLKHRLPRKMLLTTAISLVIFGIFYVAVYVMGFGIDDLPRIVPEFQPRS
jgi:predicted secreted protein